MPPAPWLTTGEQNKTETKLVRSPRTSRLARIMQCYAHIDADTQYVVLHIKLMLNVHTKMYVHKLYRQRLRARCPVKEPQFFFYRSQNNADHDILNTNHANLIFNVLKKYKTS